MEATLLLQGSKLLLQPSCWVPPQHNCVGPHPILPGGRDIPWGLAVLNLHEVQRHRGLPEIPEGRKGVRGGLVT